MCKNAFLLPDALVSQSSLILEVPTRIINARHSLPLDYTALSVLPPPPAPGRVGAHLWGGSGRWGGLPRVLGLLETPRCLQGDTELRTRPGEALPVTAALAHEAPRVACASAGLAAAAATLAGQEAFAPRRAPPPTPSPSLRRGAPCLGPPPPAPGLNPGRPEMSPTTRSPVTHPGAGQQQRQQQQQ